MTKDKILLQENYFDITSENDKDSNNTILTGVFSKCNIQNENNRIYPKEVIQREVEKIKEGSDKSLVFLGHSKEKSSNIKDIVGVIRYLKFKGNDLIGQVELLNTSGGLTLKEITKKNIPYGISTKGVGSVNEDGVVQDDYQLVSFDIVLSPSTKETLQVYEEIQKTFTSSSIWTEQLIKKNEKEQIEEQEENFHFGKGYSYVPSIQEQREHQNKNISPLQEEWKNILQKTSQYRDSSPQYLDDVQLEHRQRMKRLREKQESEYKNWESSSR